MVDKFSTDVRRKIMQQVRSKDTTPEMAVRSYLHRAGLRFRVNQKKLPGTPDLVLKKYQTVVFVHGCFWHQHPSDNCPHSKKPKSNKGYWLPKLRRTIERDHMVIAELEEMGWEVDVVWECEISEDSLNDLVSKIKSRQ